MNASQIRHNETSLSSIARKVLSVIPENDAWPQKDIASELFRVTKARVDFSVLTGCLNTLVHAGFVKEPSRGLFRRVVVNGHAPEPDTQTAPEPEPETSPANETPFVTPPRPAVEIHFLDKFAAAAAQMREFADVLVAMAETVEDAALSAQNAVDGERHKHKKLEQLRDLLKGIDE
jgi:hypothetical protein